MEFHSNNRLQELAQSEEPDSQQKTDEWDTWYGALGARRCIRDDGSVERRVPV